MINKALKRRASVALWALLTLGVVTTALVGVIRVGRIALGRVQAQGAADAAALAYLNGPEASAERRAARLAAANGFGPADVTVRPVPGGVEVRVGQAAARAVEDRNVVGFAGSVVRPAPVAPIALEVRPASASPQTFRLLRSNDGGGAAELRFGDEPAARLLLEGVTFGRLILGSDGTAPALRADSVDPITVAALRTLRRTGAVRVWPVGRPAGGRRVDVTAFVAARVTAVTPAAGGVDVTLTPARITTAAAVTRAGRDGLPLYPNPLIRKLRLDR